MEYEEPSDGSDNEEQYEKTHEVRSPYDWSSDSDEEDDDENHIKVAAEIPNMEEKESAENFATSNIEEEIYDKNATIPNTEEKESEVSSPYDRSSDYSDSDEEYYEDEDEEYINTAAEDSNIEHIGLELQDKPGDYNRETT